MFIRLLLFTRVIFYILSWATDIPHDNMVNEPMKSIYEYQVWRLFAAPYLCEGFWTDILIIMPLYLSIFLYYKEYLVGTFHAWLYFTLVSMSVQLIASAIYIPIALAYEGKEGYEEFLPLTLDWAFFSSFMVEVFRAALARPKETVK